MAISQLDFSFAPAAYIHCLTAALNDLALQNM